MSLAAARLAQALASTLKESLMRIDGAIVKEQGVTFAIVVVKPNVIQTESVADKSRVSFATIADFSGVPIILAAQDSKGVFTYQGRPDIVKFLANIDASRIPWKHYTISSTTTAADTSKQ
jgi:hypothetical protein